MPYTSRWYEYLLTNLVGEKNRACDAAVGVLQSVAHVEPEKILRHSSFRSFQERDMSQSTVRLTL